MNIKDIILKYKKVAFICNSKDHFKYLIESFKNENVVFSKSGHIEPNDELFNRYTHHIYDDKIIAIIYVVNIPSQENYEYQFYTRSFSEYDKYNDWNSCEIIDFSQLIRDEKLSKIL